MKIEIKKISSNSYTISTEKLIYTLNFLLLSEEFVIVINEKKEKDSEKNYKTVFSLQYLRILHRIFNAFESIKDAMEGIKSHLETELFGLKKDEKSLVLTLYILGLNVNLPVKLEGEGEVIERREKELALLEQIEEGIKNLTESFDWTTSKINTLIKEKLLREAEKNTILVSFKDFIQVVTQKVAEIEETEIQRKRIKLIKTIESGNSEVSSICLLKDKRLASSFKDKTIKIFNLTTYKCEVIIDSAHCEEILYISSLDNGCLVSSSQDSTIKIWEIKETEYAHVKTLREHKNIVMKTIQLSNYRIGSCSWDKTIKIWKLPFYNCVETLNGHTRNVCSLIELSKKDYLVSGGQDSTLMFWDNETYRIKKRIEDVSCAWNNSMIEIEKNRLIVGGFDSINIIDLNKFEVEKKIKVEDINTLYSLVQIHKGIILFGCYSEGHFLFLDVDENTFVNITKGLHSKAIKGLLKLENSLLVSCSEDTTIKLWKINYIENS